MNMNMNVNEHKLKFMRDTPNDSIEGNSRDLG
jgi:hypothetical protein